MQSAVLWLAVDVLMLGLCLGIAFAPVSSWVKWCGLALVLFWAARGILDALSVR